MLINSGSLMGTTTVTSALGFVYWWLAARQFSPEAVGFASAAISAMTLLGTGCVMGLGTLLIGELPRQPGKETSLIGAAVILVGTLGVCAGIAFALIAPLVSVQFEPLRAAIEDVALFSVGAGLTALTILLDQAVIGLLRGELQLWRNILASVIKLIVLFAFGLWQWHDVGMAIYATWAIGNAFSVAVLAGVAVSKVKWSRRTLLPKWSLLRKLGPAALQHHILNLILRVPTLTLPIMVTILLSAEANAWFYIAFMIANFVFSIPVALTTVLYATNAAQPAELAHKARQSLYLSTAGSALGCCVMVFGTWQVLSLFGHSYAEEAAWSLRILSLGAFPMIIKYHYVAVYRVYDNIAHAIPLIAISGLLELGAAALGAHLGGLLGLSLCWIIVLYIESVFMAPIIYKTVRPTRARDTSSDKDSIYQYTPLEQERVEL